MEKGLDFPEAFLYHKLKFEASETGILPKGWRATTPLVRDKLQVAPTRPESFRREGLIDRISVRATFSA